MLSKFLTFLQYSLHLKANDSLICLYLVFYGSWLDHVQSYWNERQRENILFVTYEEMTQVFDRFNRD